MRWSEKIAWALVLAIGLLILSQAVHGMYRLITGQPIW